MKQCWPEVFFTTVAYPIKGTPYFQKVASKLVTVRGWQDSTDRDYMVRGRHSRGFYQHADDLLKSEMAGQPDPQTIQTAREGLWRTFEEVEAWPS